MEAGHLVWEFSISQNGQSRQKKKNNSVTALPGGFILSVRQHHNIMQMYMQSEDVLKDVKIDSVYTLPVAFLYIEDILTERMFGWEVESLFSLNSMGTIALDSLQSSHLFKV